MDPHTKSIERNKRRPLQDLKAFVLREIESLEKVLADDRGVSLNGYHHITLRRIYDRLEQMTGEKE